MAQSQHKSTCSSGGCELPAGAGQRRPTHLDGDHAGSGQRNGKWEGAAPMDENISDSTNAGTAFRVALIAGGVAGMYFYIST